VKALETADLLLVRSMRDREILKKRYNAEAHYLPDAIPDYYLTAERGDPSTVRERFGIRQDKFFLYIGRIHKLKGPHILVKALKYVGEDIAAVLVGPDNGYLRETLNLAERIGGQGTGYMRWATSTRRPKYAYSTPP
jgi:glycosyltransferase involved in cell wall biosynthesis